MLDPDGNPVAKAEIFVRPNSEFGWSPISPVPKGQKGRVTASGANGQFQFELDKTSSDRPSGDLVPWHKALIATTAPGFGVAWTEAGSVANGREAMLRLARDDVPVRGRVLDTQGRPVAGVTVRLGRVMVVKDGVDLDDMLATGDVDDAQISASYGHDEAVWPGGQNTWTSDAQGRFDVRGIGRDRIGLLFFHGPALADAKVYCDGSTRQVAFKVAIASRSRIHCQVVDRSQAPRRSDVRARCRPHQADRRRRSIQGDR